MSRSIVYEGLDKGFYSYSNLKRDLEKLGGALVLETHERYPNNQVYSFKGLTLLREQDVSKRENPVRVTLIGHPRAIGVVEGILLKAVEDYEIRIDSSLPNRI